MTTMYLAGPIGAMFDKSKGSVQNRTACAAEHFKNEFTTGLKTGLVAGGATYVALAKPTFATKIATGLGKLAQKLPGLGKLVKNPTKFGLVGLAVAAGSYLLHTLTKGVFKAGQIDQKYTDAAILEQQTKKIVLA